MHGRFRAVALSAVCLLGFTGCGYFGDEHSDRAVAQKVLAASGPSMLPNYAALSADGWLDLSKMLYQQGKYVESIGAAQTALNMKPDYAEAFNNIGAAYGALRMWDPAIQADQQAVRLKPGLQLARNNLAWALTQKTLAKR
jgi:tetratricopeptide (TPR) repeat protein